MKKNTNSNDLEVKWLKSLKNTEKRQKYRFLAIFWVRIPDFGCIVFPHNFGDQKQGKATEKTSKNVENFDFLLIFDDFWSKIRNFEALIY